MNKLVSRLIGIVGNKLIIVIAIALLAIGGAAAYMLRGTFWPVSDSGVAANNNSGSNDTNSQSSDRESSDGIADKETEKKEEAAKKDATSKSAPKSAPSSGSSTQSPEPSSVPAPSSPPPSTSTWPPTPQNVGVPAGTSLTAYTGPCDVYTPNTVVDRKTINCVDFRIMTTGVVITKSKINGAIRVGTQDDYEPTVISDPEGDDPIRLTLLDSEIDATTSVSSGFRPISSSHYIMRNSYVHGSYSGGECHNACTIENSYLHGFGEHSSGLRVLRNAVVRNNTIWCEPNPNSDEDRNGIPDPDGGCSGNMTMYEEFGVPHNNLIERNYFPAGLFWYNLKFNGNDNGNIRIINNVFGIPKSGAGVADGWDIKASNVWQGNTFTNGQVANP